jgi:hypothetical protein
VNAAPAAAQRESASGTFRINLKTGAAAPVTDQPGVNFAPPAVNNALPLLPNLPGPQYLSADGRHVMARRRTKGEKHRFELMVHDRQSGELIAKFPSNVAWAPFYVEGNQVVLQTEETANVEGDRAVAQPRQVQAIDRQSGEVVWRQPIAEVDSRIPPPP